MACTDLPTDIDPNTRANIEAWLSGPYDQETKAEIQRLLAESPRELSDAFYTSLSFGTGGLRGVTGVGTNRMNAYTVRAATQGLANYLLSRGIEEPSVFIGFDCRHYSDTFAMEAARVLAGNGIRAYLCQELRPTPLVSFGCRHLGCSAAIMITASHNPPEYNGFKVYWEDGGQILPPHDKGIIDEVTKVTSPDAVKLDETDSSLITKVGRDVDTAYLDQLEALQLNPDQNKKAGNSLNVLYTNLHGTAVTLLPEALQRWHFSNASSIAEQEAPDGSFPTVESPNPEETAAMECGIKHLKESQGDILFGFDPDADRMGLAVMHDGEPVLLNGNQIACLGLDYLCETLQKQQRLPQDGAFVKTIVTTELFKAIAEAHQLPCYDVLTGFKYIAEKIREWELSPDGHTYLFGGEESYGYLLGTGVRDKDAIVSACLLAETALDAKLKGKTLVDRLNELYAEYGTYREGLYSLKFPETQSGRKQMASALDSLRETPPTEIGGCAVKRVDDYLKQTSVEASSGKETAIDLPRSNVLRYWLEDGTKLVIRPSGTEPKVKLYCGVASKELAPKEADKKVEHYLTAMKDLLS